MKVRIAYEVEEINWNSGLIEIYIYYKICQWVSTHE